MDQLKAITLFVRAVERGSLTAAAQELGGTQSNVSKRIAELEQHLGGALLVRTARGVKLTAQGQRYYERCKEALSTLSQAEEDFSQDSDAVKGFVRISASYAFGRLQIIPHLPGLFARHPHLKLDMLVSDRSVDLIEDSVDVAFRFGPLRDSALVARVIGMSHRVCVATPEYLHQHGTPRQPADLASHSCIAFNLSGAEREWVFQPIAARRTSRHRTSDQRSIAVNVQGQYSANSPESVLQAAIAGLGIAQVSHWMVGPDLQSGRLLRLLPDYESASTPIYAISLKSARHLNKVRAVISYFEAVFAADPMMIVV